MHCYLRTERREREEREKRERRERVREETRETETKRERERERELERERARDGSVCFLLRHTGGASLPHICGIRMSSRNLVTRVNVSAKMLHIARSSLLPASSTSILLLPVAADVN